jgi:hypothetical protein
MVTRRNSTNARHCLCETIVSMLPDMPEPYRPMLRRLFNQEVYQYALYAAKDRKVNPDSWRGFFAREDPLRFLVLVGLSTQAGSYAARCLRDVRRWYRAGAHTLAAEHRTNRGRRARSRMERR